jgi:hypothetical protein
MRPILAALLVLGLALAPASAEIEKLATVCDTGICFHWWPKLPVPPGWWHDREKSFELGGNVLVPEGATFGSAPTVMYATAIYKPREPELTSLAKVIERDKRAFAAQHPDLKIAEVAPLVTGGGKKLRSFTFTPKAKGHWERVSYGEEGDFYLLFTVSSISWDAYDAGMKDYLRLIESYRE